jgi:OOP family OmpA-OmpF porin
MISVSARICALTALLSCSVLLSGTAQAAILHSASGAPVTTKAGVCLTTGFDGGADCVAPTASPLPSPMQETVEAPVTGHEVRRERAIYFDFNKASLTEEAKTHLDHLANHLQMIGEQNQHKHHHPVVTAQDIVIVGFADRVGNAEYNEKLALKRAATVRDYLIAKGVTANKLEVRSLGKSVPSADCSADLPHAALVSCLREDRRVEIEFNDCDQ